jgi:hypothetical protein
MTWTMHLARIGKLINACKFFVRKPEGKRPLARPRRGWEDFRMDLREVKLEGVD